MEEKPVVEVGKTVVEIVKLPKREMKKCSELEGLSIHLRLRDSFRGIFIDSFEELDDVIKVLLNKKIVDIVKAIDELDKKKSIVEYEL
jgi:hypothetical protein